MDEPSLRVVLDWYTRRLTADRFANRERVVVPPELAGWVLADSDDDADVGGTRPLGEVRDRLLRLARSAGLTEQERTVLASRAGLHEYPARAQRRPLGERLPVQRRRSAAGLGERRLRGLRDDAVRRLDEAGVLDPRAVDGVEAGPVPDPARASWFTRRVAEHDRLSVIERAMESARAFVAVSGAGPDTDRAMADLDDYQRALARATWPLSRPLGRSRANAVVGLALWDVLSARSSLPTDAAMASGRTSVPSGIVPMPAAFAEVAAGTADASTVLAACAAVGQHHEKDQRTEQALCDVLLGFYARHRGRLGRDVEATILRTVVRARTSNEDPTALALVRVLIADHPLAWQTVDAAQHAVRVASAHRLYGRANELCRFVDAALRDGIAVPAGRSPEVEVAEYSLWNLHQRSATLRRQLDSGASRVELRAALELTARAFREHDRVMAMNERIARGDASEDWSYFFDVRAAEVHLEAARRADGADEQGHVRAAQRHAGRASRTAEATSDGAITAVPLTKVDLRAALHLGDDAFAVRLLWRLHELGWPLSRSVAPIAGRAAGEPPLPPSVASAANEIARLQAAAGDELSVDGSNQARWAGLVP